MGEWEVSWDIMLVKIFLILSCIKNYQVLMCVWSCSQKIQQTDILWNRGNENTFNSRNMYLGIWNLHTTVILSRHEIVTE